MDINLDDDFDLNSGDAVIQNNGIKHINNNAEVEGAVPMYSMPRQRNKVRTTKKKPVFVETMELPEDTFTMELPPGLGEEDPGSGTVIHNGLNMSSGTISHNTNAMTLEIKPDDVVEQRKKLLNVSQSGSLVSVNQSIAIGKNGIRTANVDIARSVAMPQNAAQVSVDDFIVEESNLDVVKFLGNGAFGVVNLVRDRTTGEVYALKEIRLSDDENVIKNVYREVRSNIRMSSKYIVKLHNIYAKESGTVLHILFEYMDVGSLEDLLKIVPNNKVNEHVLGIIALDCVRGMAFIHEKAQMLHRDIKPANILLNSMGYTKISDMGVASSIIPNDDKQAEQTFAGSLSYMSPERISHKRYDAAGDIWALGLVFIQLVTGKFPYADKTNFWQMLAAVVDQEAPKITTNEGISQECCDFVNACMTKDPKLRASAVQLLNTKFARKYLKHENEYRTAFSSWLKGILPKKN